MQNTMKQMLQKLANLQRLPCNDTLMLKQYDKYWAGHWYAK